MPSVPERSGSLTLTFPWESPKAWLAEEAAGNVVQVVCEGSQAAADAEAQG